MNSKQTSKQTVTIQISVWDEPKSREHGEIETERKHLRTTRVIEMDVEETIQSVECRIESVFCDFIDNCKELRGLHRRDTGYPVTPFDGQKQGHPVSIGALLWEGGNANSRVRVKGELCWSDK